MNYEHIKRANLNKIKLSLNKKKFLTRRIKSNTKIKKRKGKGKAQKN